MAGLGQSPWVPLPPWPRHAPDALQHLADQLDAAVGEPQQDSAELAQLNGDKALR